MIRRDFLRTVVLGAAAVPLGAYGEERATPVIGWLHSLSRESSGAVIAAFQNGLAKAGYVEGRTVRTEYRWADGRYDPLPALAADLVNRKVDVILTGGGTKPIQAAMKATATIPIVFSIAADPVGNGLVKSLARPGGNVTGISFANIELLPKRFELLATLVPRARIFGLLVNPDVPHTKDQIQVAQQATKTMGVQLHVLQARTPEEIDAAFAAFGSLHADALVVGSDAFLYGRRNQIVALAARQSLPAIYDLRAYAEAGGLASYGTSLVGAYRQSADLVAKVLGGTRPADLPVQQPTTFELIINLKTAKALGLTVPQTLLARADEVIE